MVWIGQQSGVYSQAVTEFHTVELLVRTVVAVVMEPLGLQLSSNYLALVGVGCSRAVCPLRPVW